MLESLPFFEAFASDLSGHTFADNGGGPHGRIKNNNKRAFRRAGVIFDVVLFESCVGGVAVAMTFASIFHFKCWFLWGVVLAAFLGGIWKRLWILRAFLGLLWGSFGVLWVTFLGSLEVLLAAVGCLRAPLGLPGGSWVVLERLGLSLIHI